MIGAAVFLNKDYNPNSLNPGYKCLTDGEPVPFEGTGELSTNVLWLTNITVTSAYSNQLRNTPRLLDDKYLRTTTSSILLELGLKKASLEDQSRYLASIFKNVMELSAQFYKLDEPPKSALAAGIPAQINYYHPKVLDRSIYEASQLAALAFVQCERSLPSNQEYEFVSVILPRKSHAKNMLALGMPFDDFFWLTDHQMPVKSKRLKWVLDSEFPMLCQVEVTAISKAYNHLINWGNGAGSLLKRKTNSNGFMTANKREWVTSNELRVLAQFCNIEVHKVAISNTPPEVRFSLPSEDKHSDLSYSYGLLAENLWCSLMRDIEGNYIRSPLTAWMHANDRMLCLEKAKQLSDLGFKVNGYGYGRITLAVPVGQRSELKLAALKLDLLPFFDLDVTGDEIDVSGCSTEFEILKLLYSCGHLPFLLEVDDLFVETIKGF